MFRKIKLTVVAVLLLCVATSTDANQTFTIEDYVPLKFTDLMWRLDGSAGGSRQSYSNEIDELDKSLSKYLNLSLQSDLNYTKETLSRSFTSSIFVNSRFYKSNHESSDKIDFILSPYLDSIENRTSKDKNGAVTLRTQSTFTNYDKRNNFYSISINSRVDYTNRFQDVYDYENFGFYITNDSTVIIHNNYQYDNNEHSRQFEVGAEFSIGNGRQYVGQYAFITYNILEELKNKGLLQNYPDKKTMIALTDIIYQIENKHTIDSRLKKIEKYDAIYKFLLNNKIVTENNHHLGLLFVQDAFAMFPREQRRFGFSKSVGIGLNYSYRNTHRSSYRSQTRNTYTYLAVTPEIIDTVLSIQDVSDTYKRYAGDELLKYVVADFAYGKPVSMKWQIDASVKAMYYFDSDEFYYRYTIDPNASSEIDKKYNIDLSVHSTYYYNSRSILRIYGTYRLDRFKNTSSLFNYGRDYNDRRINLGSSIEYRLNIPTTIKGRVEYSHNEYSSSDNDRINFSLSFSHYIY